MRPRIPLAYAGLLIVALLAVIGFAAFSTPTSPAESNATEPAAEPSLPGEEMSGRVASAVFALRVSDTESRTATTQTTPPETTTSTTLEETMTFQANDASSESSVDEPSSTTSPATTTSTTATTTTQPTTTTSAAPKDTTPPALKVTYPKNESTVTSRSVVFKGTVEKGASVRSGPYDATVKDDGTWSLNLVVTDGANGAVITATDTAGNSTSTRVVVYYQTPTTTTTTHPTTTTTHVDTTAGTQAPTTTSGSTSTGSTWSPNWPADSGGKRDVEYWRSTVEQYWPANRVDCALGIIRRESRGDPRAYNASSNAEGLMQHLSKYWKARARGAGFVDENRLVSTPYNGEANIAAGAYLANYYSSAVGQWWNPWKSNNGEFTALYGTCQSSNPS